jgi:membrane-associated phospholipid phosphatase
MTVPGFTRVARLDRAASAAIASRNFPGVLDRSLPLLTRAADRSVLWVGVSAALLATGHHCARRAALRGLGSLAVTSLLANHLAKTLISRERPVLDLVPLARSARRIPSSSSFPSGHAASAAAFAVGAALEWRPLAVPLGAAAAAVAFSRIYTGVHYPSDVLAGAAIGATIAAAGRTVI